MKINHSIQVRKQTKERRIIGFSTTTLPFTDPKTVERFKSYESTCVEYWESAEDAF